MDGLIGDLRLAARSLRKNHTLAVSVVVTLALAIGAGSQMLQPLAIAVIGGILISMVLSLIITPAIQYFLGSRPPLIRA